MTECSQSQETPYSWKTRRTSSLTRYSGTTVSCYTRWRSTRMARGHDVARVEKHLLDLTATGAPMPKLLYLVPTGNNPTGNTMPDGDRAKLVSLCAAHGIVIVADDVYELLQFSREGAPKPMRWHAANLNASATVISLGSWSKLLGPGLRLGWLEADEALVQALAKDGEVDSGSLTSPLVETIVTEMITSGDAKIHVDALRKKLSHRATLLADAINAEQPAGSGSWCDLHRQAIFCGLT